MSLSQIDNLTLFLVELAKGQRDLLFGYMKFRFFRSPQLRQHLSTNAPELYNAIAAIIEEAKYGYRPQRPRLTAWW